MAFHEKNIIRVPEKDHSFDNPLYRFCGFKVYWFEMEVATFQVSYEGLRVEEAGFQAKAQGPGPRACMFFEALGCPFYGYNHLHCWPP